MDSSFLSPPRALAALELAPGMQVADFDAGSGFFARAAARLAAPGTVWAVDPNRELLSRIKSAAAAEGLENIEVVAGAIERPEGTHLPAGAFDAVVVANSLFAVDSKAGVAVEAARILKKGGQCLVIDWEGSFGGLGPAPEHVVKMSDARAAFEAAGFACTDASVEAGNYHWGLVFKKQVQ